MVGNIIFNTRQIYIYRYLKMSIFHISLCKKWLSYYGQTTKNTQEIFWLSCGKTTQNMQKILHHQKSTRQISMERNILINSRLPNNLLLHSLLEVFDDFWFPDFFKTIILINQKMGCQQETFSISEKWSYLFVHNQHSSDEVLELQPLNSKCPIFH